MEAVENPTVVNSVIDDQEALNNDPVELSNEKEKCHTSNSDAESLVTLPSTQDTVLIESVTTENSEIESECVNNAVSSENIVTVDVVNTEHLSSEVPLSEKVETDTVLITSAIQTNKETMIENAQNSNAHAPLKTNEEIQNKVPLGEPDKILYNEDEIHTEELIEVSNTEVISEKVTFQTEIMVEKNYNDEMNSVAIANAHDTTNILSELGQSIEFTEALCSSDAAVNVENNNSTGKQEVFNKEELLDILEGNDESTSPTDDKVSTLQSNLPDTKKMEAQLALEQLSRLTKGRRKETARRRKGKSIERQTRRCRNHHTSETNGINISEDNTQNSIVNVLVKEWEEDEPLEEKSNVVLEKTENLLESSEKPVKVQETVINEDGNNTVIDSSMVHLNEDDSTHLNKSGDENQPQKRLSRVIKKKVIFDPDNPDTFTKSKTINKNKDRKHEKIHVTKKIKVEQVQQVSQSKSPTNKLQWKKPTSKNSKQCKRLTEIDKLLMDEGAVNMIYQLTPEASKGKKNVKTKAEFIKKLQSSTPDGKEMKFRERRKELSKTEEAEAKKIIGGKRSSLSSSVKSASVYEDFETHSADDSIIYRRHSSSSYSSACMSPRRLSDVDSATGQSMTRMPHQNSENEKTNMDVEKSSDGVNVFMDTNDAGNEVINKNDCLAIKERLNSKLSHVLNKRKRDTSKIEKPAKQKKIIKSEDKDQSLKNVELGSFQFLTISFDERLAEILIRKTGSNYNSETLKELQQALEYVDNRKDTSVTLLTSECGTLCSTLDLKSLLNENMEKRINYACEIAESARSLFSSVKQHSKLLCTGVWGACSGLAPALVALSDVAMAADGASFSLNAAPLLPGLAVFTAHSSILPRNLVNDLVLFGRRLSAAEAMQYGLVSHTMLPGAFMSQLRSIVKDLANQPAQTLLLKKKILGLNKRNLDSMFQSCLESERDMLVEYWTSAGGQEALRATLGDG